MVTLIGGSFLEDLGLGLALFLQEGLEGGQGRLGGTLLQLGVDVTQRLVQVRPVRLVSHTLPLLPLLERQRRLRLLPRYLRAEVLLTSFLSTFERLVRFWLKAVLQVVLQKAARLVVFPRSQFGKKVRRYIIKHIIVYSQVQ